MEEAKWGIKIRRKTANLADDDDVSREEMRGRNRFYKKTGMPSIS